MTVQCSVKVSVWVFGFIMKESLFGAGLGREGDAGGVVTRGLEFANRIVNFYNLQGRITATSIRFRRKDLQV